METDLMPENWRVALSFAIGFILFGLLGIVSNYIHLFRIRKAKTSEEREKLGVISILMPGAICALGVHFIPFPGYSQWWWVSFIIDPGSLYWFVNFVIAIINGRGKGQRED